MTLELFTVRNYPDKFGDIRYCDKGDLMCLFCPVTSNNNLLKWSCGFTIGSLSPQITTLLTWWLHYGSREKLFDLSRDLKTTFLKVCVTLRVEAPHSKIVSHYLATFNDNRRWQQRYNIFNLPRNQMREIMFLIYHVT